MSARVRTISSDPVAPEEILVAKRGRTLSVCIPCRDEAATIGSLVSAVRRELMTDRPIVDELIVLDDRSTDDTARVAERAGARVVSIDAVHRRHGTGHGKGNALWATLVVSSGDVVVWCDGDVTSFEPGWIGKLALPLLDVPSMMIVKAAYHRPTDAGGGGRTTELVARPLISRCFPSLAGLEQPLSGEYAVRRAALEQLSFVQGWGVEMGLLIDIERRWGADAIGQVDLGRRVHRHRSLQSLSVQAAEVMATMLDRAGVPAALASAESEQVLERPDGSVVPLNLSTRPPVASLRHAKRA